MPRQRTITTAIVVALAALVVVLAGAVSYLIVSDVQGRTRDRQSGHDAIQQNVRARYDDCLNGEQVRQALRQQVQDSKRTDPLLYKLLPQLDTPEVRDLVRKRRARQLRAYAPRDCREFALAAVPPENRRLYRVP